MVNHGKLLKRFVILAFLIFTSAYADERVNANALFNGQDGLWPNLKLSSIEGRKMSLPPNAALNSSVVLSIQEAWNSGTAPKPRPTQWTGRLVSQVVV